MATACARSGIVAEVALSDGVKVPGLHEARQVAPGAWPECGFGICDICRGPAAWQTSRCWSCREVVSQLGFRPPVVSPICLFAAGSGVHRALVGYKAAVSGTSRAARAEALSRLLQLFLADHLSCLSLTQATLVPVPSSVGGRPSWNGVHPLIGVCEHASQVPPGLSQRLRVSDVLRPGCPPPGRLEARRGGFVVKDGVDVGGETVIVVDDVFTSGARALSAAAALRAAGTHVAAVVPLGRLVRPEHNRATRAFWAAYSGEPFDPGECCLCSGTGASHGRVLKWPGQTAVLMGAVGAVAA